MRWDMVVLLALHANREHTDLFVQGFMIIVDNSWRLFQTIMWKKRKEVELDLVWYAYIMQPINLSLVESVMDFTSVPPLAPGKEMSLYLSL